MIRAIKYFTTKLSSDTKNKKDAFKLVIMFWREDVFSITEFKYFITDPRKTVYSQLL